LERVIEERRLKRERAIEIARRFAECVDRKLELGLALLYGSYARGDFNEWSDIDVLLVAREELPANPIKRLSLIEECLMSFPGVEPLILTTGELKALARKNPLIRKNINEGVVLKGAKEQIYESGEQGSS
jgi:predicted nucleotidyltransferase